MNPVSLAVSHSLPLVWPALLLLLAGCVMLAMSMFVPTPTDSTERRHRLFWGVGMLALLVVAGVIAWLSPIQVEPNAQLLFARDASSIQGERLTIFAGILVTLLGWNNIARPSLSEHYGCLAILISGMLLTVASTDLTVLYLSLELISIPTYVMLGLAGSTDRHREATVKYVTLSALSSGIFLFGASYLYGIAGSTALVEIAPVMRTFSSPMASIATTMVLVGLAFRITAVPFHFYAPDVFEGTSITLASILSFFPKLAGFWAILRIVGDSTDPVVMSQTLVAVLMLLGVLTMTIGNILALIQTSVRRLLAYSSVAHSGYVLAGLGVLLARGMDWTPIYFYFFAYAAMTLGTFAVLAALTPSTRGSGRFAPPIQGVADLKGLAYSHPGLSLALAVCLLSLTGLPLTAGFWAKLQIVVVTMASGSYAWVGVLVTLNAAVAAGYYLSLLVQLYSPADRPAPIAPVHPSAAWATAIATVLTIVWFFIPPTL